MDSYCNGLKGQSLNEKTLFVNEFKITLPAFTLTSSGRFGSRVKSE